MQQRGWIDLLIIAAVALVVHGLLLVDSGVYFDDWLVYTFVVKRDWHLLTAIVRDRGIPPIEQYYWWMFRDLPVFGYRAAVFIMIIGSAWLAMLVGRASTFLSRQESLLVAVFIVCYSGFQSWVLFCTSQYVFFYCLFLAAALLAFQAEREQGWRHWARRGAALTLFATSYCLGSLLFLTMVFGVLLLLHIKKIRGLTILRLIVTGVPRRLDYFALPVIYWYGVHWLIPPRGLLEGYNTVLRSTDAIVSNLKQFAINSVAVQFRTGLDALGQHPSAIVAAVALAVVVWSLGKRWGDPAPTPTKWLLPFALVWAIGAMFPYAAVNKPAAPIGWDTRHALLVSYPLGVAIVALARLFQPRRTTYMSLAAVLAVISLPAGMAITTMRTYVDLQARAVRDRSVMQQLVAMPDARESSVFWVRDRVPQALGEEYRYFEWAGMFEHAFGDQTRAGFDRKTYQTSQVLTTDQRFFTRRYRLKDFDPAGCQVEMTIDWGDVEAWKLDRPPSSWSVVRTYHWLRFFGRRARLTRFLDEVTTVRLQPLDAPEAIHCARSPTLASPDRAP